MLAQLVMDSSVLEVSNCVVRVFPFLPDMIGYNVDAKVYTCNNRLLDSLVVECWLRVREVPGSISSQGPRHTKDVIKMVPVVPLFSTEHSKG